ncbi:MAG: hypothetical protein E7612_08940 [Ruminococcaceae bacterium]|nr:hypothetical protein [Oscillospiraceae bacterium]
MENIKIPVATVLEMDDVGWDNGRDLRLIGQASRSGLPRYHALEDYEFLNQLSEATGSNIAVALCLGDWDKENFLRGEVGVTHDPNGWDRKSEIDLKKFTRYRDTLEKGHVDYMVHGILHGRYTAEGKCINEHEWYEYDGRYGEGKERFSEEDFRHRLDLFFKIYDSWGFKQKIRGFVVPCSLPWSEDVQRRMCKILREYGIIYWADNFKFPETLRVMEGVACFKWGHNGGKIPWDAYDFDPSVLGDIYADDAEENSCLRGTHWTNFLRFNPENNKKNVAHWAEYYKIQSEVFGGAMANNLAEGVNQLFYHEFTKMSFDGNSVVLDFSEVEKEKLECHKNELLVSFKKGITPKSCAGGEISLYEEHKEFNTYKIVHTASRVTIKN